MNNTRGVFETLNNLSKTEKHQKSGEILIKK